MAITETVEINRPPQDVFAYLDDLARHGEWQEQIVDVHVETEGPVRVGTRAKETRRVPGGPRTFTYEITEHDPPNRAAFQVLDGPVRASGTITLEPLDGGARTRYSIELNLDGHGFGKLIAPLARKDARKQLPKDMRRLKERLESGA